MLLQSAKPGRDNAGAADDVRMLSSSLTQLQDGSVAFTTGMSSHNRSPGHAHGATSRDIDHQSFHGVSIQPDSHAHFGQTRDTDDHSVVDIGVTSQPIAELIRREFELLRIAPSAASQLH